VDIGIKELKAHLSAHLARVKAGDTVVITDRGKPVAKLVPAAAQDVPAAVARLLASGEANWSGEPLPPFEPIALTAGAKTIAQMIAEDRR
jgi:prevent-host-death family protein